MSASTYAHLTIYSSIHHYLFPYLLLVNVSHSTRFCLIQIPPALLASNPLSNSNERVKIIRVSSDIKLAKITLIKTNFDKNPFRLTSFVT